MPYAKRTDRKLDPENNPKHVPGAEWEENGVKYRRAKNGACQRFNYKNNWVLCQDPTLPPSSKALKTAALALKNGQTPFSSDLPLQDRIRLQLREIAYKMDGDPGRVRLTRTLAGVQSLSFATRYLEGGRTRFLELVQLAALNNVPVACKWYAVYADLDLNGRMHCSFDDVCAAAGISPDALMACLVSTGMKQGVDVGNLVAAALHPDIVRASAESAKRIVGDYVEIAQEDRRMQFLHHQFIPVPKGTTINISANAKAAAAASAEPTVPKFAEDARVGEAAVPEFLRIRERKSIEGEVTEDRIAPDPDE